MDTTIFEQVDKFIEVPDVPKVALSLILGIDIENGRLPGIVTAPDLIKIKSRGALSGRSTKASSWRRFS